VDAIRVTVVFQGDWHALGTTTSGEDVLTGVILGARISVRIGVIVVFVATLIGSILGALAGYFGGPLDELVMRITDVFLSIPGLILALAVAAALGHSLDNVMYALIIVYWPPYTRLVRGQALSVRENLYIEASRATGASEMRVVTRHVLPNAISPILVQSSLDAGSVVLVAAGLSFLGIGAQPGTPEWGLMVSTGFTFFPYPNWWQVTFSGLMIFLFVLGFNLLGDGVRDILDPRLRR
jgi:peptide/nickel transport system permease protein